MFEGLDESHGGCETEQSDKKQSDRKPLRLMPSMCGRNELCDVWNVLARPNGQIAEQQRTTSAPKLEHNLINHCINGDSQKQRRAYQSQKQQLKDVSSKDARDNRIAIT